MNKTTTGCANCWYCFNGQCSYGGNCYGTQMILIDGRWYSVPIGSQVYKEVEE